MSNQRLSPYIIELKACEHCGKQFNAYHKGARFCSQQCGIASRMPGKTFISNMIPASRGQMKFDGETRKAKDAFFNQRCMAVRTRGIDWEMTFEQWWKIWKRSGHWGERGRGKGKYVMARFGDKGPYSIDNVKIIKMEQNLNERRMPKGEQNAAAKLNNDDVREIRRLEGLKKRTAIAKMFGINYWHVWDIQKRRSWSWLE